MEETGSTKSPDATHGNLPEPVAASLYHELRQLARRCLRKRPSSDLMRTTTLVHEAWLRLRGYDLTDLQRKQQYAALAATVMRSVLVDEARRAVADKRGGGWRRVPLGNISEPEADSGSIDILDLDQALAQLERLSPRRARIVELRFFGGLSVQQTAHAMTLSERTVEQEWRLARAWLRSRLELP